MPKFPWAIGPKWRAWSGGGRLFLLGVVVCLMSAAFAPRQPMRETAARMVARAALAELGILAGVRDEAGSVRAAPLLVEVVQSAGPRWVGAATARAVADDPAFESGRSAHLLHVEVAGGEDAIVLVLHLWRQGWDLRNPMPLRIRVTPWISAATLVAGAWIARKWAIPWIGMVVSGVLAQLLMAFLPWGTAPSGSITTAWRHGMFGRTITEWARAMPSWAVAVAAGVIVSSSLLAMFDHLGSRKHGTDLGAKRLGLALLATVGALAWIEAGVSGGLLPWLSTWAGLVGMSGGLAVWVAAVSSKTTTEPVRAG